MGGKDFNPTKKLNSAETNAGEVVVVRTDRIVGLRKVSREQPQFAGQGCSSARAMRLQSSAPLKDASTEKLECPVSAAGTGRCRTRKNKTEIPTIASFS